MSTSTDPFSTPNPNTFSSNSSPADYASKSTTPRPLHPTQFKPDHDHPTTTTTTTTTTSHATPEREPSLGMPTLDDSIDADADPEEEIEEPVKFVFLAEFDIDQGATLTHQYPFPTGCDEHTLAELMLPDGAHLRTEDWTIFYLNQTPRNAVKTEFVLDGGSRKSSIDQGRGGMAGSEVDKAKERGGNGENGSGAGNGGEGAGAAKQEGLGELLFVLNCVRMKEDKSVRRGAMVKALAICTTKPFIQIYKPLLLLALEEYYQSPSPSVLSKLFDSLNAIPLRGLPMLTRPERIILRNSERTDLFLERFEVAAAGGGVGAGGGEGVGVGVGGSALGLRDGTGDGTESLLDSGVGDGGGMEDLNVESLEGGLGEGSTLAEGNDTDSRASIDDSSVSEWGHSHSQHGHSRSGGSGTDGNHLAAAAAEEKLSSSIVSTASAGGNSGGGGGGGLRKGFRSTFTRISDGSVRRMKKSSRASLKGDTVEPFASQMQGHSHSHSVSQSQPSQVPQRPGSTTPSSGRTSSYQNQTQTQKEAQRNLGLGRAGRESDSPSGQRGKTRQAIKVRDTHYFDTVAVYSGLSIPIRVPLATFAEEVGDYSVIQLLQTFTPATPTPFSPPFHPHLHSAGAYTHPIILLMNALLTQKRIIFLGHGQPAGHVANYVLAACSLLSPVLRGFTERAFPYSNLAGLDMMEEVPGYIAGVTNPRFEDLYYTWDILCNLETGKITVSKALVVDASEPTVRSPTSAESSNFGYGRADDESVSTHVGVASYREASSKQVDSLDNVFMEDITSAVQAHYGEPVIRARFFEYMCRFVRMAGRYEEEFYGQTAIGFPSRGFRDMDLGSGFMFVDEPTKNREFNNNAARIEGWRKSRSYTYWKEDFHKWLQSPYATTGLDLQHQLARLRYAKAISDKEAALIYKALADHIVDYPKSIEASRGRQLLSHLPAHTGGLTPVALGLFHRSPVARNAIIDLLDGMQTHPVGKSAVTSLNIFQQLAYQRLSEERSAQADLLNQGL